MKSLNKKRLDSIMSDGRTNQWRNEEYAQEMENEGTNITKAELLHARNYSSNNEPKQNNKNQKNYMKLN